MPALSHRSWAAVTNWLVIALDFVAVYAGGWLAHQALFSENGTWVALRPEATLLIVGLAACSALLFGKTCRLLRGEALAPMVGQVILGWLAAWAAMIVVLVLTNVSAEFSPGWLASWGGITLLTLALGRAIAFFSMAQMHRAGYQRKTVLLYGDPKMMSAVRARIKLARWSGFDIVDSVVPADGTDIGEIDATLRPDEIWISLRLSDQKQLKSIMQALRNSTASIKLLPDLKMYQLLNQDLNIEEGVALLDTSTAPGFGKRKIIKTLQDYG